jgi:hypothetical protein
MDVKLHTEDEVIKMLRLDERSQRPRQALYKMRRKGEISYVKVGRRIYYTPQHIAEFISRNTVPARQGYGYTLRRSPLTTCALVVSSQEEETMPPRKGGEK